MRTRTSKRFVLVLFLWQAATLSLFATYKYPICLSSTISSSAMLQLFVLQRWTDYFFFEFVLTFLFRLWEHSVHSLILYSTISLFICATLILIFTRAFSPQLRFFWHCFIRPFSTGDQKSRLDEVCLTPTSLIIILTTYPVLPWTGRGVRFNARRTSSWP